MTETVTYPFTDRIYVSFSIARGIAAAKGHANITAGEALTAGDDASLADRSVIGDDAELTLALVQIKSYCIHGWPPGLFCASL